MFSTKPVKERCHSQYCKLQEDSWWVGISKVANFSIFRKCLEFLQIFPFYAHIEKTPVKLTHSLTQRTIKLAYTKEMEGKA